MKLDDSNLNVGATVLGATHYLPSTALGDGLHTLYVAVIDQSGNRGPAGRCSVMVKITTVAATASPSPSPTPSPSGIKIYAPNVTVTLASGSATPTWTWTSGGGGTGHYRVVLDSSVSPPDFAGATPVVGTSFTPNGGLTTGNHLLAVEEAGSSGDWGPAGSAGVKVLVGGAAPPTVLGPVATNLAMPTWTWISGGTGNGAYRYHLDSSDFSSGATPTLQTSFTPTSPLQDGVHTLYVEENSSAGIWSLATSFAILIDTRPPSPPIVTGPTPTNNASPTWRWTSGGGGAGQYRCQLDSSDMTLQSVLVVGAVTSYTPFSTLSDGPHTLYVQEEDSAGNWSATGSFSITVDTAEPNPPIFSVGQPYTSNTAPTWTWGSGGGGNGHYRYKLDDQNLSTGATATLATTFTPATPLASGPHLLYVQETDDAGNWSPNGSYTFEVDTVPPIAGSSGNITVAHVTSHTLDLTWVAGHDNITTAPNLSYSVYYSLSPNISDLNGVLTSGILYGTPGTNVLTKNVANLTPSTTYYFTVVVTDQTGNNTPYQMTNATMLADLIPPTAGGAGTVTITAAGSDRVTVNWTAGSDDASPASALNYSVYYSTANNIATLSDVTVSHNGTAVSYPASGTTSQTVTGLQAGVVYYFNVIIADNSGNLSMYHGASQRTLDFAGGSGTSGSPYQISNLAELQNTGNYLSAYFQLASDIDASATYSWFGGNGFVPIGNINTPFTGNFDGNGKTINHLWLGSGTDNLGLFGVVATGAVIKNLAITNLTGVGANALGGLVGLATGGSISRVSVQGSLTSLVNNVGLLVGDNSGASVTDSVASGMVRGGDIMGGLVGHNSGTISRGYAAAELWQNLATPTGFGGLVGKNDGQITTSFSFSYFSAATTAALGALVGINTASGSIASSYAYASPFSPAVAVASDANAGSTVCTLSADGRQFFDFSQLPLSGWVASNSWLRPDNGQLPVVANFSHNLPVTFAADLHPGRRISAADKTNYQVWGYCSNNGATINLTAVDSLGGAVSGSTKCTAGMWKTSLDLAPAAQGMVTLSATQTTASVLSATVTLALSKQTTFCDGSPVGTFAGGTGTSADPYTICSMAQLMAVGSYPASGLYFRLMNNIDLSSGFTTIGGTIGGSFDGNGYVLSNSSAPIFNALNGATAAVMNLGVENANIVVGSSTRGILVNSTGATGATLQSVYTSGQIVGTNVDSIGGIIGSTTTGANGPMLITGTSSTALVVGRNYVGGIVGRGGAAVETLNNVLFNGYVMGLNYNGLIGGYLSATLTHATTSGINFGYAICGGVVGSYQGTATVVTAAADIYCANGPMGGFAGQADNARVGPITTSGYIFGSYWYSGGIVGSTGSSAPVTITQATVTGDNVVGSGLVGTVGGNLSVTSSSFSGNVGIGGLVGYTGNVTTTLTGNTVQARLLKSSLTSYMLGGFIGSTNAGTVLASNNSFSGSFTCQADAPNVTGLMIGSLLNSSLTLTNNYAVGSLNNSTPVHSGGIIGSGTTTSAQTVHVTDNYVVATGFRAGLVQNDTFAGTTSFDSNFSLLYGAKSGYGIVDVRSGSVSTYTNNYYLQSQGAITSSDPASTYGTAVTMPQWFLHQQNAPMTNWDYTLTPIWKTPSGGGLPIFFWQ